MKTLITILSIIITLNLSGLNTVAQAPNNEEVQPDVIQEYVITNIDGNDYYGKSITSDAGIYFTTEYITGDTIHVGDMVEASFSNEYDDSLIKVVQQDTTQVQEYIITNIDGDEYFGQSTISDQGIYFTSEYIEGDTLHAGDIVQATFANEYDDSLIKVNK